MNIITSLKNLTKFEIGLWIVSVSVVTVSYLCTSSQGGLSLTASLIGVTALIFVAKGNVLGQILTVLFSVLYAIISYTFRYYGEMITYMCMTAPIAAMSVAAWLKHPYSSDKAEVRIRRLTGRDAVKMGVYAALATLIFYFVLSYFKTNNLFFSTLSITTSFSASYLTYRRSRFYALAYAANDVVLIVLWILAAVKEISYLPMIFCFAMFLANDIYGYVNWSAMEKKQNTP